MKKLLYTLLIPLLAACGHKHADTEYAYQRVSPEFSEDSAHAYISKQCDFGPRTMNSAAHDSCGNWIASKFEQFGAKITNQYADSKLHDGTPVKMRNIIASVNPDADVRIIIAGHWDSRPWADNDDNEDLHNTPIDGANDGASSIGIMLEMARIMNDSTHLNPNIGVDFICWDAEDCGNHNDENSWCLGSQYWADHHHVDGYVARYGINLDMVGGRNTVFEKEAYSMRYAPTVVDRVWSTALQLGYDKYFLFDEGGGVTDDHIQVNKSGIPCIDIIGNDAEERSFPTTWHTISDNIHNIDKQTLKAVGQTVLEVIYKEK